MKKKGFTLIELLAVIVILAIIAIIAVPIILNVIEKSKESSAVDSAYGYIHALEEGIVEEEVKNNTLVENKEYNDLREFENDYDINVKGNKPTKGTFRLEKRQVVYAEFIIDGYNVVCERGKCEAKGKTELITITYDTDGGSVNPTNERIGSGTKASLPTPTKEHYGFVGWFTAQTGGEQVTHQTVINESMTLYARWIKDSYTITFDGNGGTPDVSTKTVEHGKTLDAIPGCTPPEGYTFNGWYLEDNTEILPSTTFTESKTLYAHYTKNIYTITYNAGSGSVTPTSTIVEHGSTLTLPTPTRLDYSFDGWYTSQTGGQAITNQTPITSTQTLYAHWTQVSYTLFKNGPIVGWSKAGSYQYNRGIIRETSTTIGNQISMYVKAPNIALIYVTTDEAIDLTEYNKLVVKGSYSINQNAAYFFPILLREEKYGKRQDLESIYTPAENMDNNSNFVFLGHYGYNIPDRTEMNPMAENEKYYVSLNKMTDNFVFERDISKASGKYYVLLSNSAQASNVVYTNYIYIDEVILMK